MGLFGDAFTSKSSSSNLTTNTENIDESQHTYAPADSFNQISSITETVTDSSNRATTIDSSTKLLNANNTQYSNPINIMAGGGADAAFKGFNLDLGDFFGKSPLNFSPSDGGSASSLFGNGSSVFTPTAAGSGTLSPYLKYGLIGLVVLAVLLILKKKK